MTTETGAARLEMDWGSAVAHSAEGLRVQIGETVLPVQSIGGEALVVGAGPRWNLPQRWTIGRFLFEMLDGVLFAEAPVANGGTR